MSSINSFLPKSIGNPKHLSGIDKPSAAALVEVLILESIKILYRHGGKALPMAIALLQRAEKLEGGE